SVSCAVTARSERFGEALVPLRFVSIPRIHLRGRPARIPVSVAVRAGIRCAERDRQIGSWHSQAVIVPGINNHVGGGWHVTGDACRAGAGRLVVVMWRRVVLGPGAAGGREGVA